MRALIVDDEAPARRKLRRMLSAFADVEVVGEAADGREAVLAPRVVARPAEAVPVIGDPSPSEQSAAIR